MNYFLFSFLKILKYIGLSFLLDMFLLFLWIFHFPLTLKVMRISQVQACNRSQKTFHFIELPSNIFLSKWFSISMYSSNDILSIVLFYEKEISAHFFSRWKTLKVIKAFLYDAVKLKQNQKCPFEVLVNILWIQIRGLS